MPAGRTSPFLFWCVFGACCRDQSIPILVCNWCMLSGPVHPSFFWCVSGACCRDQSIPHLACIWYLLSVPVHSTSGVHLEPTVGTSPSLFWCVFSACCRDQSILLPVCIWSLLSGPVHPSSGGSLGLLSGPVHPSSGVYLVPEVETSPSHFWWASGACYWDQSILVLSQSDLHKVI